MNKSTINILMLLTIAIVASCQVEKPSNDDTEIGQVKLDIQGHRGARGLMPENTIRAFLTALELGVTTLELDLAVTRDNELLVSHEPYMNPEMCYDSLGQEIPEEAKYLHNIYQMTFDQIQSYDCGSKEHPRFPKQKKIQANKPLLKDVVDAVNAYISQHNLAPINYNIEIKSRPEGDKLFHPTPKEFSDLVYSFIKDNIDLKYVTIQSFDFRVLKYFNKTYPDIGLAVLIENKNPIDSNLNVLGFVPEIYSCDYTLLTQEEISYLHKKDMQVIPWTVNNINDMQKLISWQVDGIITDYPDSIQSLIKNK